MTRAINLNQQTALRNRSFREFIFIGNITEDSVMDLTEQLHLAPNNKLINKAVLETPLLITQIHTVRNMTRQLKKLQIEPGAIVKLVSKTNNGSVILKLGNNLIGIGAEIANRIVVAPAN